MVTKLRGAPSPVYRVHDRDGRPIGEVRNPSGEQLIGRGAGTVLLLRADQRPEARRAAG